MKKATFEFDSIEEAQKHYKGLVEFLLLRFPHCGVSTNVQLTLTVSEMTEEDIE